MKTDDLNKYINKWVAFEDNGEDKVVGFGKDAVEAKRDAQKNGYKGELVFFKVFPFSQYVPTNR